MATTSTGSVSIKVRLAVALSLLLVCATLAEAIARLAHVRVFRVRSAEYIGWATPDPVLGWRNKPGVYRSDEGAHEPMTFLADGSRATGTPPGAQGDPVVVIGCSFAEGYGLRDDQTFEWLLQKRFPQRPILNFGVPGYSTWQSLTLLSELVRERHIHPAAVIYGFIPMHAERNVLTYAMLDAFRGFGGQRFSPPHVELRDGALQTFPPFVVANWPLEEYSAVVTLAHQADLRVRLAGREKDDERVTAMLLNRMKALAARERTPLLVATLWHDGPPGMEAYRRMAASMQTAGLENVDITYAGTETDPLRLQVAGVGHPGAAVHEWWAEKLGAWLQSRVGP